MRIDISVIIVSWNVRELLRSCLRSIFEYTKGVSFEVIVVDNASSDGTVEMVSREFPGVQLIANAANEGFAKANNIGLRHAIGAQVLFLNPDTELIEDSVTKLHGLLEQRPEMALAGPRVLYADRTTQPSVKGDPMLCDQIMILSKLFHWLQPRCLRRYLGADFDYGSEQRVEQLMGAVVAARLEVIREAGGWNEQYLLWWEDLDLCKKLREKGHEVWYTPITAIVHHEGKSLAQQLSFQKQALFNRGMRTYFRLHRPRWEYALICLLQPFSLLLALLVQMARIKPRTQSRA